jgi:hypothetical protein
VLTRLVGIVSVSRSGPGPVSLQSFHSKNLSCKFRINSTIHQNIEGDGACKDWGVLSGMQKNSVSHCQDN